MRKRLVIPVIALLLAGCTITTSNIGHLIIHVWNVPGSVVHLSYVAKSDAGWGHYRSGHRSVRGGEVVLDLGDAAEGVWEIEVQGKDASGRIVYEQARTGVVRRYETTIVSIWGGGPPPFKQFEMQN